MVTSQSKGNRGRRMGRRGGRSNRARKASPKARAARVGWEGRKQGGRTRQVWRVKRTALHLRQAKYLAPSITPMSLMKPNLPLLSIPTPKMALVRKAHSNNITFGINVEQFQSDMGANRNVTDNIKHSVKLHQHQTSSYRRCKSR